MTCAHLAWKRGVWRHYAKFCADPAKPLRRAVVLKDIVAAVPLVATPEGAAKLLSAVSPKGGKQASGDLFDSGKPEFKNP